MNFSTNSSSPLPIYLSFKHGFFHGGSPLFYNTHVAAGSFFFDRYSRHINLTIAKVSTHANQEGGLINDVVDGFIFMESRNFGYSTWSGKVKGVWIAQSDELCMAACVHTLPAVEDQLNCQVKINFGYPPKNSSITKPSIVKGRLESQRNPSDPLFFHPIVVSAFPDLQSSADHKVEGESKNGSPNFKYPDGSIFSDLSFVATLKTSSKVKLKRAYFASLSIDKRIK